jgi:hypothetical protein
MSHGNGLEATNSNSLMATFYKNITFPPHFDLTRSEGKVITTT